MSIYQPAPTKQGDATAMSNTLTAYVRNSNECYGFGVFTGLTLNTSAVITAGKALVGTILVEAGQTLTSLFTGKTGTYDLFACAPVAVYDANGIMTAGGPDSTGASVVNYQLVSTGLSPSIPGTILCTAVVSAGTITSVNNAPSGRVQLQTIEQIIASSTLSTHTFNFPTPASTWIVTHNLGRYPSVTIVDTSGDTCWGDIQYTDSNHLTITFNAAFGGTAYLN